MAWPYVLIGFLSVVDALIGGYVFLKNPTRLLNRVFFAFAFGMALIGTGMILLWSTHHIVFDRLIFAGGYLMIFGLVMLSMRFPTSEPMKPSLWFLFSPLLALAALTPFGFLVKEVIFRPDGILEPVNGPGIHVFMITIGAYFFLSCWEFRQRYKSLSGTSRLQMQYLALGAGIFALTILVCNVLLPALGVFELNMLGPISSIAFVGLIAYAIVRHHLMDIRVVIQRSLIYLCLVSCIAIFYLAVIFALSSMFNRFFGEVNPIFAAIGLLTVCIGIFTVPVLERYFRHATDKLFFKDGYDYPKALHGLSSILNRNIETSKIVQRTSQALKEIFRASEAYVLVFSERSDPAAAMPWYPGARSLAFNQKKTVLLEHGTDSSGNGSDPTNHLRREYGLEALTPIFLGRKRLGAIVLGRKKSGDAYTKEDAQLLDTFSYQAATALEKARLFGELQSYSGVLEERVWERTAKFEQLQEEQKQMMIDISHRLQTPLAAVKSELDFLKRQPNPPEHLETFERSIDGISKFIYDLLSLARLGIRKNDFQKDKVNLSELLKELVEYFGVMAAEGNIQLKSQIEPNVSIAGSKDHLEELVMNLSSNAFKYLEPAGKREVVITLSELNGEAVLKVADSGRGIAQEDLKKIFERFYRGKQAGAGSASGTGLGLAIAKRIVENHGGKIVIDSEPRQGTIVTVRFPVTKVSPSPFSS